MLGFCGGISFFSLFAERVACDRRSAEPRVGALRDPPTGAAHHAVPPPAQLPAAGGGCRGGGADAAQVSPPARAAATVGLLHLKPQSPFELKKGRRCASINLSACWLESSDWCWRRPPCVRGNACEGTGWVRLCLS